MRECGGFVSMRRNVWRDTKMVHFGSTVKRKNEKYP